MSGDATTRLHAKVRLTPDEGYNLVGVDDFEEAGNELYLIDSFDTRVEAEQAMKTRKSEDADEVVYIYGDKDRVRKSDAIDTLGELAALEEEHGRN